MHVSRRLRTTVGAIAVVGLTLGAGACAKDDKEAAKTTAKDAAVAASSAAAGAVSSATSAAAGAVSSATSMAAEAVSSATSAAAEAVGGENCTYKNYGGAGVEKIDLKGSKLGFAQSEKEDNPFRTAETQSMKDEAKKLGYELVVTNAGGDLNQEITDIKGMIAQGVKAMIISPLKSDGLQPALDEAKAKKVPVFTVDRLLVDSFKPCDTYIGFAGSDFVSQGKRAGEAMIKATGGTAKAITLLGSPGVNVADDRNKGYRDAIAGTAGIEVLAEQTGNFNRADGQKVTEQLLASHPDLNAIYAHNDEMALGAKAALEAAGKKAGDVKIITIDGTKGAVQGIVDGWIDGVIESNPRFGPIAFATLDKFYNGDGVPAKQIIEDTEYTKENAKDKVGEAY